MMEIPLERSCRNRIDAHLESRAEDFTRFMHGDLEHEEEFNEYGLDFDLVEADTFNDQPKPYYRFQLSWGGPSDEIRFYKDGTIQYWFLDWFDGASKDITGLDWVDFLEEDLDGLLDWDRVECN